MVRKLASQVPAQVSRLLQANLISPPTWYHAALAHPPPSLPARQVVARSRPAASADASAFPDLPPSHLTSARAGTTRRHRVRAMREPKPRVAGVVYDADVVRRQFFRDFPFEAFRPVSLVETREVAREHAAHGAEWTALEQRGAYPTVEDTIDFTLILHKHHALSLSHAYAQATAEFVVLRARHELATIAAEHEARAHGATFRRDPFTRAFDLETRAIQSQASTSSSTSSASASALPALCSTKRRVPVPTEWTAAVPGPARPGGYTRGAAYVAAWTLPAPADVGAGQGDLVGLLGDAPAPAVEMSNEEEMDDMDVLQAFGLTGEHEVVRAGQDAARE
ncbi:mitochondrial ribosomal small subunit component [Cryptotrichosporon argae]